MEILSFGIDCAPGDKIPGYAICFSINLQPNTHFPRSRTPFHDREQRATRHPKLFTILWKRVHVAVESVFTIPWKHCSPSRGIRSPDLRKRIGHLRLRFHCHVHASTGTINLTRTTLYQRIDGE
jgi:hypothetical protein